VAVVLYAAVQAVVWVAPAAEAYRRLSRRVETPVEVFD
jgi:hypothetical protein